MSVKEPYITPPRAENQIDRWRQRVSELLNQLDGLSVYVINKTTAPFLVKANRVTGGSTIAVETVEDTYTITVADATSINNGDYVGVFSATNKEFYQGVVLSQVGNVLTMDRLMDHVFTVGDIVGAGITDMSTISGAVTPVIYAVRGADPGIDLTIDITRILFTCLTSTALQLTDFGDIAGGLTRGLLIRRTDGDTQNQQVFKTNIEMKGWMLDWDNLDDSNPGQGLHGFVGRLTYNGKSKLDTAIRIGPGEELQFIVQDDITSLLSLEVMCEGSEVPEEELNVVR